MQLVVLVSNPGSESMTVYLLETWMRFPSQTNTLRGWLRMHFWHLSMQWVGPMRIVQLLAVMTLLQIGVCFSQSKANNLAIPLSLQNQNPPTSRRIPQASEGQAIGTEWDEVAS